MPQYMLLITGPAFNELPADQQAREMPQWAAFGASLSEAGHQVSGGALQGIETATTLRVRDGETVMIDGPFAECKEYLAGYYLIDCPDLDTALAHAARVPSVTYGSVEVRPLIDFGAAGAPAPEVGRTA